MKVKIKPLGEMLDAKVPNDADVKIHQQQMDTMTKLAKLHDKDSHELKGDDHASAMKAKQKIADKHQDSMNDIHAEIHGKKLVRLHLKQKNKIHTFKETR